MVKGDSVNFFECKNVDLTGKFNFLVFLILFFMPKTINIGGRKLANEVDLFVWTTKECTQGNTD